MNYIFPQIVNFISRSFLKANVPDAGDVVVHAQVLDDGSEDHSGAAGAASAMNNAVAALEGETDIIEQSSPLTVTPGPATKYGYSDIFLPQKESSSTKNDAVRAKRLL